MPHLIGRTPLRSPVRTSKELDVWMHAGRHDLAEAAAAARRNGDPWRQIAAVLGTSRQAAQQRYGEPATLSR